MKHFPSSSARARAWARAFAAFVARAILAPAILAPALRAQISTLPTEVVTATRTPQPAEQIAFSVATLDAAALRAAPTLALDGALRGVAAFSLFRRSDSLSANPTAQGVSLRGLGPSGASRSLVLLDGVPLNDPFGGWVAWSKVPREGLARAELVPGGGATAWGNAALGGVVQLFTVPAQTVFPEIDPSGQFGFSATNISRPRGRIAATFGDFHTRSLEFVATQSAGRGAVQLLGNAFATDGFALVAPERRGAIDVAAWSRHRWLAGRWRTPVGESLEFTATARTYEEFRGNGTPYTRNGSREKFLSAALAGAPAKNFAWTAVTYAQDQSFASTFSGVNATRTTETPASDQFAVPSTAYGAAWTGTWQHNGPADTAGTANTAARTSVGLDARAVRGETREHFTFTAGNFTRLRVAGGAQKFAGLFALHERPLAPELRATLGARLDAWRDTAGHRRETDRNTAAVFRDDHYAGQSGTEFSPSAGLVWTPQKNLRLRANAQHSFRRPTLNELYRPFRQGANVTEANSALRTERATSCEVGVEWTPLGRDSNTIDFHGSPPSLIPAPIRISATAFTTDLRDAVGNVTLARGPGTFPIVGTLAVGGLGRQRLNLDRTRTQGLELSAKWHPFPRADSLALTADALFNDATVRRATVAPLLVGKRIAQVPRRTVALGASWRAPGGITFTPRVRWIGRQFEDDENQLVLGEAVVADLGASRALTRHLEFFLTLENLANTRLETGRSADGIVNLGTPRLLLGGLRGKW
ncbi:MAG: Colicin receptor precursor [Verrucomicrobiota bacterium]